MVSLTHSASVARESVFDEEQTNTNRESYSHYEGGVSSYIIKQVSFSKWFSEVMKWVREEFAEPRPLLADFNS